MEALRAVPRAQREGAYALGATRWQVTARAVLPAAWGGILTGIILALARAIGETAPLILVGAAGFVTFAPSVLGEGFTVLPMQIFQWAGLPQADFQGLAAAAIVVLLVMLLLLNAVALLLRARLGRHIQW
jgi:phosphate transport system permease protein